MGLSFFQNTMTSYSLPAQQAYMMAISFLMTLPMIIIFFLAQKNYLQGMAIAGVRK